MGNKFKAPQKEQWLEEAGKQPGKKLLSIPESINEEGIKLQPIYPSSQKPAYGPLHSYHSSAVAPYLFTANNGFNKVAKEALKNGQSALNIDLDDISQFGIPVQSFAPLSGYNHLTHYKHFHELLSGIDLTKIPLLLNGFNTFDFLHKNLLNYCADCGIDSAKITGGIGADPTGAALLCAGFTKDINASAAQLAAILEKNELPRFGVITINADIIHNSGGHALHELSYILAAMVNYLILLEKFKIPPQKILSKMRVKIAMGNDQFKEIAKIRALHLLWDQLCKVYSSEAVSVKIDAITSWRYLSVVDVHTNMLRNTSQVFSALIAGCNTINILPFDLLLKKPDEFSCRQARNTALILQQECNLTGVTDPASGSAFLENYTLELAEKAWAGFKQIEENGGLLTIISSGKLQAEIKAQARKQAEQYKNGLKKAVGINYYRNEKTEAHTANSEKAAGPAKSDRLVKEIIPLEFKRAFQEIE
jgi:methylmalonyl-CoA mutase